MSDAVKPAIHGRDHREGGSDPIPMSPIQWIYLASTTNWGSGLTTLDWTEAGGSYDSSTTPTFAVNGDGNLEIGRAGSYKMEIGFVGESISGAVETSIAFEALRISGATPNSWRSFASWQVVIPVAMPDTVINWAPWPFSSDFLDFDSDAFDAADPCEIQVQAVKYEDGVGAAETSVVSRLLVYRMGPPFA